MVNTIRDYVFDTNEYGKPNDIKYFWNHIGKLITEGKHTELCKNDIYNLDKHWIENVVDDKSRYTGGFSFYKFLYDNQHRINSFEDFEKVIEEFTYEPVLSITKESELLMLKNNNAFNFDNAIVYRNTAINEEVVLDNKCEYIINTEGKLIKLSEDTSKELSSLDYKKEYLGVKLNTFGQIPKHKESRDKMLDILLMTGLVEARMPKVKESEHSFVAEESKESQVSREAEHTDNSEKSKESNYAEVAGGLTDDAFLKVVDGLVKVFSNQESAQAKILANLVAEINRQQKYKDLHTYKYRDKYEGEFLTEDIYKDSVLEEAKQKLKDNHILLIVGDSGSSKTELAHLLANHITGEAIGIPEKANEAMHFKRICVASARSGNRFWYDGDDSQLEQLGDLRLFAEHIEKNEIKEPCVFIGNEIQASDFGLLIGNNLFEILNKGKLKGLPENLYIILTGCPKRDFGIDKQVFERLKSHVSLTYYTDNEKSTIDKKKFISVYGHEDTLDIVNKINTTEEELMGCQVISNRELIKYALNSEKIVLEDDILKELSEDSKKLLMKLGV